MPLTSPNLLNALQKQISKQGLDGLADLIIENTVECYSMTVAGPEDYASTGNTRFGGDPDLPKSFPWPCDGEPRDPKARFSNFIAQINFAEFPPAHAQSPLPREGILYLFVRWIECAAEPVLLDAHYFNGPASELRRTRCPDPGRMCDEYLIDLAPQKMVASLAISLPFFRKDFLSAVKKSEDSPWYDLDPDEDARVGQVLGYANAGDIRDNLYRQVVLGRMCQRDLMFNDYWNSMEEYEADMRECREREPSVAKHYESMRPGVTWLVENREAISAQVADWRLLFRLNSNSAMNLNMNDGDPLYVFIRDEDLKARKFDNLAGEVTQG